MTISFPRALPDQLPILAMSFYPEPTDELSPLRGGGQVSANLGPTLWRARWQSDAMGPQQAGVVQAWYDTILSQKEFYGYPKLREYPLMYPQGFAGLLVDEEPFNGTCKLTDVASNNVEIELAKLPEGFKLSPGDMLAFDYAGKRALHRMSAAGEANGQGELMIEVRPHIRVGWQVNAVVNLYRPAARMVIVPKSWSEETTDRRYTRVSFEAIQSLM